MSVDLMNTAPDVASLYAPPPPLLLPHGVLPLAMCSDHSLPLPVLIRPIVHPNTCDQLWDAFLSPTLSLRRQNYPLL